MGAENSETRDGYLRRQLASYRGIVFRRQVWRELSPDWDHDHCKACWARFAARREEWSDNVYTEGYVTLWPRSSVGTPLLVADGYQCVPAPAVGGFQLDWLCPGCFDAVREELGLVLDPDHPQWKQAGLEPC
jgi:hypothetical protein